MGTDADRREEARMEEVDARLERRGYRWVECGGCDALQLVGPEGGACYGCGAPIEREEE